MSQQSENARQLLQTVVDFLDQNNWDSLSLIEKEQVKRKLTDAYDQLFAIPKPLSEKVPSSLVNQHELVVVEEKITEFQAIEVPKLDVPIAVENVNEPILQKIEQKEVQIESEQEAPLEIKLPVQDPISEDKDDKQKSSLNDRFLQEKTTLADKISRPQGSLKTLIDVNEKFFFIRDLFGADNNAYDKAIRFLDNLSSYDDAMIYIERELAIQYKWDPASKAREKFIKQLKLRFGK